MKDLQAIVGTCIFILLGAMIAVVFMPESPREAKESLAKEFAVKSETEYGHLSLITIKHDDHWFVAKSGDRQGGIIHHPSCPCITAK